MKKELSTTAAGIVIAVFAVLAIAGGWIYMNKTTSFGGKSGKPNPSSMGSPKAPPPPPPGGFPRP